MDANHHQGIRVLCLSGSLREQSYNTALLETLPHLCSSNFKPVIFSEMGSLPLFNPDREREKIPAVLRLKEEISLADGVIIASPEYAHGISAVLKNALDWVVSDETFPDMPVLLFNCSPRATHAQLALREVLKTMSAKVVEQASVTVPLLSTSLDAEGILNDKVLCKIISEALACFSSEIISRKKGQI